MKTQNLILLVVEENEMPKRQSLKLIKQLAEKLDAQLHLYLNVYRRGYEKSIKPGTRQTKSEAHHVVEARHWLDQLKTTLSRDSVVAGETLNWKLPNKKSLPSFISTLAPQYIVAVRQARNTFKRIVRNRKHWKYLSNSGVPVIFTDPDFPISLSKDVWAAVDTSTEEGADTGLNDLIITQAQALADLYGGDVHLVHFHHTGYELTEYVLTLSQSEYIGDPGALRRSRDEQQVALEMLAKRYNIPVKHIHNLPGVAKVVLPILASRKRPLFVVAGATRKSPIKKWLVGSTSKSLLKRLTVPLCLVHQSTGPEDDN